LVKVVGILASSNLVIKFVQEVLNEYFCFFDFIFADKKGYSFKVSFINETDSAGVRLTVVTQSVGSSTIGAARDATGRSVISSKTGDKRCMGRHPVFL
jgi:hypothetical protein